jgi:hypothetical protein
LYEREILELGYNFGATFLFVAIQKKTVCIAMSKRLVLALLTATALQLCDYILRLQENNLNLVYNQ